VGGNIMDTVLDSKFVEKSEAIITQLGYKDLKSFVKSQALLMLLARMDKLEMEIRQFETKYQMDFMTFDNRIHALKDEEVFEEEDDYLDWRFAYEALNGLKRQKQELEYA
jgi:hypothetical protein